MLTTSFCCPGSCLTNARTRSSHSPSPSGLTSKSKWSWSPRRKLSNHPCVPNPRCTVRCIEMWTLFCETQKLGQKIWNFHFVFWRSLHWFYFHTHTCLGFWALYIFCTFFLLEKVLKRYISVETKFNVIIIIWIVTSHF